VTLGVAEHLNIDLGPLLDSNDGYITTVPTTSIPRRLVLTANCYHFGGDDKYNFTFILDVLLVPPSFNLRSCFDLYLEPYNPHSRSWYMGTRRLRDNIILLRRFGVTGEHSKCAVDQWDVPEDIRSGPDYRLVVTCPVMRHSSQGSERGLFVQLEMEF